MVPLEDLGSLDTLEGRGDLDEDTLLANALLLVELNEVKGLVDRGLGVEGEASIDLGRNLAGDDLENLLAELDEEAVESIVDLGIDAATLLLGEGNGVVDELGVLGLLGGGQDQRGVGGGILRLVLVDGCRRGKWLARWLTRQWRGLWLVCVCVSDVSTYWQSHRSRRRQRCRWP